MVHIIRRLLWAVVIIMMLYNGAYVAGLFLILAYGTFEALGRWVK